MSVDGFRVVLVEPDPAETDRWLPVRDIALVENADMGLVLAGQLLGEHGSPAIRAVNTYADSLNADGILVTGPPVPFGIFIDGGFLTEHAEVLDSELIVATTEPISE